MKKTSFLILAAGDGKRLKTSMPKFMFKVKNKPLIIWQLEQLNDFKFDIYILIQPNHQKYIDKLKLTQKSLFKKVKLIYQEKKRGIMNAVTESIYKINFKYIILIWCDQILISNETFYNVIQNYNKLVLPLIIIKHPYVQISVNNNKIKISETVEGDKVSIEGQKDIGLFKINRSYFKNLILKKESEILKGKITKEKNFLKIFEYINLRHIKFLKIQKPKEGLGINDISDAKKVDTYL